MSWYSITNLSDSVPSKNSMLNNESNGSLSGAYDYYQDGYDYYSMVPPDMLVLQNIIVALQFYYIPCLTAIGFVSNVFSCLALSMTKIKKTCCGQFLIAITSADAIFLLALLGIHAPDFGVNLYKIAGWCQFITFVSHVSSFLSMWFMVCFIVDLYILKCHSYKYKRLCNSVRTRIVILSLTCLAVVVFLNISLTVGVAYLGIKPVCTHLPMFIDALKKLSRIDVFVNAILPYTAMIGMLVHILIILYKDRKKRLERRVSYHLQNMQAGNNRETNRNSPPEQKPCTCLVLTVVTIYMLLNLPCQVLRILHTIREIISTDPMTPKAYLWQQVLHYPYYTRFGTNMLVYLAASREFRKAALKCLSIPYKKLRRFLAKPRTAEVVNEINGNNMVISIENLEGITQTTDEDCAVALVQKV